MMLRRLSISSTFLCVLVAVYIVALFNKTVISFIFDYLGGDILKTGVLLVVLALFNFCLLLAFSAQYLIKFALIFFLVVAGAAAFFIDQFGVIITPNMIENAATTTQAESSHLITAKFIIYMLLYIGLPSLGIILVKIRHRRFTQKLWVNSLVISGCLLAGFGLLLTNYASYASMIRDKKTEIVGRILPLAPISSAIRYAVQVNNEKDIVALPLGEDAVQIKPYSEGGKKRLTVVVVGETARAMNFSLNGYPRETNPGLKQREVFNFTNTSSCGTETAVSVPCMFSPFPRTEYSSAKFRRSENLVDVLSHAGLQLEWYENNTGTKRVADRIETIDVIRPDNPNCQGGECYDQVLVDELAARIDKLATNGVIVLHMLGSHGPAYYRRYPADQEAFKPSCNTSNFSECSQQEIINAYDNSILYTDKVLSEVIDLLKSRENTIASSMIFMSDHGESLGEKGLYLHAMPYFIAPKEQTHIPFVAWFSPQFISDDGLNASCLKGLTDQQFSHDNLFHTVLGMMGVKTSVYDPALDAFQACRKPV